MPITSRAYANLDDLRKIQATTADWIAASSFVGYLHVEDIAMRILNVLRRHTTSEILRLWEDETGTLRGWSLIYPRWNTFDALMHPAEFSGNLAAEIFDWAENETRRWMQQENRANNPIKVDVFDGDSTRSDFLLKRGYQHNAAYATIAQRSLAEPLPDTPLPDNFSVRSLAGAHEAQQFADVQNAAFRREWTADEYQHMLNAEGYVPDHHMVAVAPDGRFAAFCYIALDARNKLAMFEDIGTHPDFQHLGLAQILLCAGMRRMIDAGMENVLLPYQIKNDAAKTLYEAVGFRPKYTIIDYSKIFAE